MDMQTRTAEAVEWLRNGHNPTPKQIEYLLVLLRSPWIHSISEEDKQVIRYAATQDRLTKSMVSMLIENLRILKLPVSEASETEKEKFDSAQKEMEMLINKIKNPNL